MRISNVRWDNRKDAPSSNSLSFRSEASFQSKGSDCRQSSILARNGCARFNNSLREDDVRTAFKVLEGYCQPETTICGKILRRIGLTRIPSLRRQR